MNNVEFNTIEEVITNSFFIQCVKDSIKSMIEKCIARPKPKPGYYYKKDWYERMSEQNILNADFFIKSIPAIWCKKSTLSSEIREVILTVCNKALIETIDQYNK
jgi:hypothetical protein